MELSHGYKCISGSVKCLGERSRGAVRERKDNYNNQSVTNIMAAGGPGMQTNGDLREGEESSHHMVSDDMLYKLSKKIAQLTKVIYSLNTKNDDLEFDMENMRHGYEDKLEKVSLDK